ncbi:two-component system phosphate regulon sensor histidine kinase PhoR [Breoghania corrubedonensis]|uniref:histidine kinase n=1 Tax=Breoghania corrubedonensis TaxID=665038 RepID=A0A2T5VEJ1_9HYPH|nr:ATP-binding protein [Breoghania corrubedonensis]PTW62153.1 two-component system phosphate regulon sensor histidine kinase PhoR [Breoghania corrubedonensis]
MSDLKSTPPDASDTTAPERVARETAAPEMAGTDKGVRDARDGELLGDLISISPMRRLIALRWLFVAIALMLAAAVVVHQVPPWYAALAFAIVVMLAAVLPQRRATSLSAGRTLATGTAWPDTGMKIAVDALAQPCFIVDRRGITRYVNMVAGRQFASVKPGDPLSFGLRPPALLEALDRVTGGGPAERISWSEKVPTESWFEAYIAPVRLPAAHRASAKAGYKAGGARPDFVLVSVQDLTEQHRLERMRADFVANASHELRTPLASLTGFVETLQGAARDDPAARERFLAIMLEQASRMGRLIDDLLSLSRIELKVNVRPDARVELGDVVRDVVDALSPLARELDVELQTDLPDEPMMVAGERDELVQVMGNLAENALKYGSSGERVLISCARAAVGRNGSEWRLSVRDWGPGIPAEHLPRLTERFYRVDATASRQMKGTGLGLAIVKHILNRHRARLEVQSEPGHGATFTVCIRAVDEDAPVEPAL